MYHKYPFLVKKKGVKIANPLFTYPLCSLKNKMNDVNPKTTFLVKKLTKKSQKIIRQGSVVFSLRVIQETKKLIPKIKLN